MGVINCPKCGQKVSDIIMDCPHCGEPILRKTIENKNMPVNTPKKKKTKIPIIIVVCFCFIVLVSIFSSEEKNNLSEQTTTTNTQSTEHTHSFNKWKIFKKATIVNKGEKHRTCENCGNIEKKEYTLSENQIKDYLINNCKSYDYKTIARDPDKYKDKYAKLSGEVIQLMEYSNETILRVDITLDEYGFYSDTVYVVYNKSNGGNGRILENDIITMYGILDGIESYTSVLGSEVNLPKLNAYYIEIN